MAFKKGKKGVNPFAGRAAAAKGKGGNLGTGKGAATSPARGNPHAAAGPAAAGTPKARMGAKAQPGGAKDALGKPGKGARKPFPLNGTN